MGNVTRLSDSLVGLSGIKYAYVACDFFDFKIAHSLQRHLIQVHNLLCDTIVQGRSFPHIGHVMRRPNERKRHRFPRTVIPDNGAVSQRPDVDPAKVSDRPTPNYRFVGLWPNIRCVFICNNDGSDNLFGQNRTHDIATNPLRFSGIPIDDNWRISQRKEGAMHENCTVLEIIVRLCKDNCMIEIHIGGGVGPASSNGVSPPLVAFLPCNKLPLPTLREYTLKMRTTK